MGTRLVSVQVGLPRLHERPGASIVTGIFKEPVTGPVWVGRLNLAGDGQADLSVHGGVDKAVYSYPAEHYPAWRAQLGQADLPFGAFGENLTVEGLPEDSVAVGDRWRIGTALFAVTQPRMPCAKLAFRLERPDIGKLFLGSRRTGAYLKVLEEGELEAGQPIDVVLRHPARVTIAELAGLLTDRFPDPALLRRALDVDDLAESWRAWMEEQLERAVG